MSKSSQASPGQGCGQRHRTQASTSTLHLPLKGAGGWAAMNSQCLARAGIGDRLCWQGLTRRLAPPSQGLHSACSLTCAAERGSGIPFLFAHPKPLVFVSLFPSLFLIHNVLIAGFLELSKTNEKFKPFCLFSSPDCCLLRVRLFL